MSSLFLKKISAACLKKDNLFEQNKLKYALRSMFAGAFLTMSTAGGGIAADKISHIHPDLAKFTFSFLFAFGLIYILFLNAELATSNMMYLSAGTLHKKINIKRAVAILMYCIFFNLVGAYAISALFAQTASFIHLGADSYLVTTVSGKLSKSVIMLLSDAILANIFVNVAIVSYLLIEHQTAKIIVVISAIFMFVYLGQEHVVANFASFGLVHFSNAGQFIPSFTTLNVLIQWILAFIGNCIGGFIIGLSYTWLNEKQQHYND